MAKRILTSLRLDKIAAVDRPCQEHATMTIMKRAGEPLVDIIAKRWIDPADGVVSFDEALQARLDTDTYCRLQEAAGPAISAFETAARSIVGGKELTAEAKLAALRSAAEAFLSAIGDKAADMQAAIAKAFTDAGSSISPAGESGDHIGKKEIPMPGENEKVAGLEKQLADLQKKLEAQASELALATAMAKMSDKDKEHLEALKDDEAKKAFVAMSPAERSASVTKALEADAVVYKSADGSEFRKSDDPRLAAMAKQRDEDAAELRKERDARVMSDLRKRADDEFAHLPGTLDERAAMLKAVAGMDETLQKSFEAVFKAAEEGHSGVFKEYGRNGDVPVDVKKKADTFIAKAKEIEARDKISSSEALRKARTEDPEGFEAYQKAA